MAFEQDADLSLVSPRMRTFSPRPLALDVGHGARHQVGAAPMIAPNTR